MVTLYRRAPVATAWPREAEATALRQALAFDSSPKQIGLTMINSTTNTAHRGCGSSVTSAVASPLVLVSLALAVLAVVAVVGAHRRRRTKRVYLNHAITVVDNTSPDKKGGVAVV